MPPPPADSQFPASLHIGQPPLVSPQSEEINVDKPLLSSHLTRFRDRDEYLWDIMQNGPWQPEYIDASAITVAGIPVELPFMFDMHGISVAAHGSFRNEPDLWYWSASTEPPVAWYDLHVATFNTVFTRRLLMQSVFGIQHHQDYEVRSIFRIVWNGVTMSMTEISGAAYQNGGEWPSHTGACSMAATLAPGAHTFRLQYAGVFRNILDRAIFQSAFSPHTSFLFH